MINPNDLGASYGHHGSEAGRNSPGMAAKKQFAEMNQHYIHHNPVLPPDVSRPMMRNAPHQSKDPYANMPMKPNQISMGNDISQLHKQGGTPAGTSLRTSSPTGHRNSRDIGSNQSPGRAMANVMMSGEYKPDFGQIQKVMPNNQSEMPQYASQPAINVMDSYENINIQE